MGVNRQGGDGGCIGELEAVIEERLALFKEEHGYFPPPLIPLQDPIRQPLMPTCTA